LIQRGVLHAGLLTRPPSYPLSLPMRNPEAPVIVAGLLWERFVTRKYTDGRSYPEITLCNVLESYSYRMKLREEISKLNMLEIIIGTDQSNRHLSSHGSLLAWVTARNSWRDGFTGILSNRKKRKA
jgi:hypothetical protein